MNRVQAKLAAVLMSASLTALSLAGDFSFTPGTWSNLTGTAATSPSLIETVSESGQLCGSLSVKATSSGTQTLGGTWSFTVDWKPSSPGETAPVNVQITFWRSGTPTVGGNGFAKITSGGTDILNLGGANAFLSDVTQYLPSNVVTLPLVAQGDGTYRATGNLTSGMLSSTYNSQSATVTKVVETFAVGDLKGVN